MRARHVVVATDGALPALVPEYAGRVRSRRLHMVATEPLPPTIDRMVYARWGYEYLQQRPDGRILAGGFSDLDGDGSYTDSDVGSPLVWERVEAYVRDDVGTDARVSHRWAGVVGFSDDLLPYVGEVPGRPRLYVSGGYSGHGVPGFMCGQDLADTIAGDGPGCSSRGQVAPSGLKTGGWSAARFGPTRRGSRCALPSKRIVTVGAPIRGGVRLVPKRNSQFRFRRPRAVRIARSEIMIRIVTVPRHP